MAGDVCNIGVLFRRSLSKKLRPTSDDRDVDLWVQCHCPCLWTIPRANVGSGRVHDIVPDRLGAGGGAIAHAITLVADRPARRLDFWKRCVASDRPAPVYRPAVARPKPLGWHRAARTRELDVDTDARVVEICRCSQNLI